MPKRSVVVTGTTLLVASLALAACGSRSNTSSTSGGEGGKVAKIGALVPLTGDIGPLGLGIRNGVDLAVKKANADKMIPGWTLEVVPVDDEAKAAVGQNGATKLASDDNVIGVVGDLNSSVSQVTIPIFKKAGIVQVSPANTNPTLTKENGTRVAETYFRTCTTDDVQGPFAARYLKSVGITKVATVNDKKTYGQGLVAAFEAEFKKGGGTIVTHQEINADDTSKDYTAVLSKIKPTSPQVVYYGGEYPQAGPLAQQMKTQGITVPLMGGDGIYDQKFIDLLKADGADGALSTSVGAPTDSTPAGKKFLSDYAAAGYKEPAGAYGAYAFDAAMAIIQGLKTSLASPGSVKDARAATVKAVQAVSFDGVTGKVAFDQFGDATNKVLTVYKVKDNKWVAEKTDTFQ